MSDTAPKPGRKLANAGVGLAMLATALGCASVIGFWLSATARAEACVGFAPGEGPPICWEGHDTLGSAFAMMLATAFGGAAFTCGLLGYTRGKSPVAMGATVIGIVAAVVPWVLIFVLGD